MHAPIWTVSLVGASRSSRAIRLSCRVLGIASGGRGPVSSIPIAAVPEQPGLQHGLRQLLDEQWHAIGLGHDLLEHLRRQGLSAGHLPGEQRSQPAVEPVQARAW